MEVLMYWDAIGDKLLTFARVAGIVAAVWLAVAIPAALLLGPLLARVSADCPGVDDDDEIEEALT